MTDLEMVVEELKKLQRRITTLEKEVVELKYKIGKQEVGKK